MNSFSLAWASIKSRPLNTSLCVTATSFGISLLCCLFILFQAIEEGYTRNAAGIDIVVGAKGSPLQLVLSTVYHADVPTGNIDVEDMLKIRHHKNVKKVIPITLGDSYRGWRIVGTTPDYLAHYQASFADGDVWHKPFDAVAGALTGLKVGTEFASVHGLSADSDDAHHFHLYKISGTLNPTGTVLDRLILTSVESVQELHKHADIDDPDAAEEIAMGHQVTALLVKTTSPIAVMNLPRSINRSSNLLAAAPSYEMTRLAQSLGLGKDLLSILGLGFITLSSLMLLSALTSNLSARRYDLGVLRVLGATPNTLFLTIMMEGLIISGIGTFIGLFAGHVFSYGILTGVDSLKGITLTVHLFSPSPADGVLMLIGIFTGIIAGLLPALSAAKTDIALLLARGRA